MQLHLYWFISIAGRKAFEFNGPRRAHENVDTTCSDPAFDESGQLANVAA